MQNYLLKNENAVYYEAGFSCDNVLFLSLGSEKFFITDSRYTQEAKEEAQNCEVIEARNGNLFAEVCEILTQSQIKELVLDPKEFSLLDYEKLQAAKETRFMYENDFSWKKRIIKTDDELKIIRKAVSLGREAFDDLATFIAQNGIGQKERQIYFQACNILKRFGELGLSFDPIVAINENAAKPHALPSDKTLQEGDLLLVDAGVKYKRYCSDRTRTSFVDNKLSFMNKQQVFNKTIQKAYDAVLHAQENCIMHARSGMSAKEIDALTRDVITEAGFGEYYIHSTGHGVGLDIHEHPFINVRNDVIIEDNMVYTIEPGIYIPGEFGIRIEDMVVMKNSRAEVL